MTCGNPVKHKLQKVIDNWLDMFWVERKLSDEQIECMQFGICDYVPRQVEEVPFFHYWLHLTTVSRWQVKLGRIWHLFIICPFCLWSCLSNKKASRGNSLVWLVFKWSGRQDSNLRPSAPKAPARIRL